MVHYIDRDNTGILLTSPNPGEFGRLGKPHFKGNGTCKTNPQN